MFITQTFIYILGLGLSIPSTFMLIYNMFTATYKDNYKIDAKRYVQVYLVALLGWAMVFGIKL